MLKIAILFFSTVVAGAIVSGAGAAQAKKKPAGPQVVAVGPTTVYPSGKSTIDVKCHSSFGSTLPCRGHVTIWMAEGPNHVVKLLLYGFFRIAPEQTVTLNLHATGVGKEAITQLLTLAPGEHKGTCPVVARARQGRSHKKTTISHVDDYVMATG